MSNSFHTNIELFTLFDTFLLQCHLTNFMLVFELFTRFDTFPLQCHMKMRLKKLYIPNLLLKFKNQNISKFRIETNFNFESKLRD